MPVGQTANLQISLIDNLLLRPKRPANQFVPRLYGFKIHPLAYQIQQQAAANFKVKI